MPERDNESARAPEAGRRSLPLYSGVTGETPHMDVHLNGILRQKADMAPRWTRRSKDAGREGGP